MTVIRRLGAFETTQVLASEYAVFNVVAVLCLENGPTAATLKRALRVLQARHPLLGTRVVGRKRERYFETDQSEVSVVELVRLTDEHWRTVTEQELNRPLDASSGPPLRCTILVPSESSGAKEIVLTFHHAVIDAASGTALLDQLLRLCTGDDLEESHTAEGNEVLPPAEHLFPERFRGLRRFLPCAAFTIRQMIDELTYGLRTGGVPKPRVAETWSCRIVTRKLPRDLSSRINRIARSRRVTLNSLLAAAMMSAVQRHLYDDRRRLMRHMTFANLRPYLRPPVPALPLGSCFGMMRLTVEVGGESDLWQLAKSIDDRLTRALRRGDKFVSYLMSPAMMRLALGQTRVRMGSTALSHMGVARLEPRYGDSRLVDLHAFVSNFNIGPEFAAQSRFFAGRLCWDIVYLDSDMNEDLADRITEEMSSLLRRALEEADA